jgi:hypothetical protein
MKVSCWEVVAAVAVGLAVVLALWKDWIWARIRKPKLKLSYDKEAAKEWLGDTLRLRILVTNADRSTARICYAKLLRIRPHEDEDKGEEEGMKGKNILLRWANRPASGAKGEREGCVHLAHGEGGYVDVAEMTKDNKIISIPYLHDKQAKVVLSQEAYYFAICAYSDNTLPSDELYLRITRTKEDMIVSSE